MPATALLVSRLLFPVSFASMIASIKNFFEKNLAPASAGYDHDHKLRLSTAALMIEMMHQDANVTAAEVATVKRLIQRNFGLDEAATHELYELAERELKQSTDYHQFTRLISRNYTYAQKIRIIEYLWMVAYADRQLDKYEEHMVRRIADLIHVSHSDFMQAKHRILARHE